MSHFTRIQTSIRDLATLQSALTQLDVSWEKATIPIRGYQDQTIKAELVFINLILLILVLLLMVKNMN